MGFFKKVNFTINGVEYEINPTMRMVQDAWNAADLIDLRQSIICKTPHLPNIALVLEKSIVHSGKSLSAEEIFVYYNQGGEAEQTEVFTAIGKIYASIFPRQESDSEKKTNQSKA